MAIVQVNIKTTEVETQRIGYIGFSLTNMLNSSEPLMASGSVIEIGGSLYELDANTDIDPGGDLAGISNGNMVWMYINASVLTSLVTTTEPIWSEEKQGWYDATETYRYYACMFKDGSGNFVNKQIIGGRFWSPEIFITDDYTVSDEFINMEIVLDSSSAANKTVTLPTLSANIGKKIKLTNNAGDTYYLTIEGEGAETINTLATGYLIEEYQTVTIKGNSSEWQIIAGSMFDNTTYQTYSRTGLSNATDSAHYGFCEFFASKIIYHMWGWIEGNGASSSPSAVYTPHRTISNTTKALQSGIYIGRKQGGDPSTYFDYTDYPIPVTFSGLQITATNSFTVAVKQVDAANIAVGDRIIYSTKIESEL